MGEQIVKTKQRNVMIDFLKGIAIITIYTLSPKDFQSIGHQNPSTVF